MTRHALVIALYRLDRSSLPVWHPDRLDLESELITLLALLRIREYVAPSVTLH